MKITANIKEENETDVKQIETILAYENKEINIEENLKVLKFNEKNKIANINENGKDNNNDIPDIEINIKENNNNINVNNIYNKGLISNNYFINSKNDKKGKNFDKYKSEEIKQLNSNYSRSKVLYNNNNIKNNNF